MFVDDDGRVEAEDDNGVGVGFELVLDFGGGFDTGDDVEGLADVDNLEDWELGATLVEVVELRAAECRVFAGLLIFVTGEPLYSSSSSSSWVFFRLLPLA